MQITRFTRSGFTLVELIVVVVILWILWTVGFVSYSGYIAWARDSNRITQLKNINDSLVLYGANKTLSLPDDYVTVFAGSNVIWYQGYVWKNVLDLIDYRNGGKDPWDDQYFSYFLSADRKKVQLLGYLEETDSLQVSVPFINTTYAATDYSTRYPKVYGNKLGILTLTSTQQPIQEVSSIVSAGDLDVSTTSTMYTAHLSDSDSLQWNSSVLTNMMPNGSCKRIKETWDSKGSGKYSVNPTWTGSTFQVYCDMEIGWGGWTHIGSKVTTNTQTMSAFGSIVTEPGVASNVSIPQDAFRTNLTEAMACSTENCWVWSIGPSFQNCLENSCNTVSESATVTRVSGSTGFQSMAATSFWYNWDTSNPSSTLFDIQWWGTGMWASTTRWAMDGSANGAWSTGDQWDIYVR